ncbi:Outer membrane protein beta-barrel domain-containing protein [Kaistella treverensis]|uniref:Outer membrane protein beta-barrel domain-containing protein n=1 Tax=Kaistella treverensis TaxID=631455 RepID=A0A1I3LPA1_9FLAO|nr:outer membrane beta-barrel protein [Kaistella treverensis]SFI86512.1 Outer membrane protein beta-barrel domain-containing protein [Kaistella treverensis]
MKKILSTVLVGASLLSTAQVTFAGKANLLFKTDSPSWKNIKSSAVSAYDQSGKNNVGFNVGLSAKIDLPASLFVMPEIYYTTFKNEFTVPETSTTIEAKSNRVDVPVLLGYRLLGDNLGVFIGPVASYNLSSDNQYNDFKENALKDFTLGYQFGAQVQIQKLILNARYEGAFTEDQREFINSTNNEVIRYDSRPSLFMVGIGYQL